MGVTMQLECNLCKKIVEDNQGYIFDANDSNKNQVVSLNCIEPTVKNSIICKHCMEIIKEY